MATVLLLIHVIGLLATLSLANPFAIPDWTLTARDHTLRDCLASADITTSAPSNASWSSDIEAWNARVAPMPAVVVFPHNEDRVSAAIKCAAASKTKVTTIGGNRSFQSMAFGRNDGALVVNLVNMTVLTYDEESETLTYGGPITISDAARYLWFNHSRTLMHGRCPDVGMTGVGFGGGFGTLSRLYGTVVDDVISVRIALANGTIVNASASENPDILWAVRGAAQSFGVVLTVTIETFVPPSENVVTYTIGFSPKVANISIDENVAALTGIQDWAQSEANVDNLSVRFYISTNASMRGFFYGTTDEFSAVSAGLLQHLPPRMSVLEQNSTDFWTSENLTTPGIAEGSDGERRYFYITSTVVPGSHPLTHETAKSLFENTAYKPQPSDGRASGFIDLWGGAFIKTVAPDDTAWKHDDNLLLVRWDLRTSSVNQSFSMDTLNGVKSNFDTFVDAYKKDGGVPQGFPNYRDSEWTVEETAEYLYGSNWERLKEVKEMVDPEGVFNSDPQDVPV